MAISHRQDISNNGSGGTSLSATFPLTTVSGNCVIVAVGFADSAAVLSSITDTAGNTYSLVSGTTATQNFGYFIQFWEAHNITGGFQIVTMHFTSGTTEVMTIIEYSGVNLVTPIGNRGVINNQGSGNPLSPVLTVSNAGNYLVTEVEGRTNTFNSVNAPFNFVNESSVFSVADYGPGTTGTFQATFNPSESTTWGSTGIELIVPSTPITNKNSSMFLVF